MKYFITGATGFIGAHLVESLIEQGHDVHALYRSKVKADGLNKKAKLYHGDLFNLDAMRKGMEGCDYVCHLAAYAKVWSKNSGDFYRINVVGTNNVLNTARLLGIKKVVVVSTAGIYGASLGDVVTEEFVRRKDFFNEYEGSKALSESLIKDHVIEGMDIVIVNPTRVYGPYLIGRPESASLLVEKYIKENWRFIPGQINRIGNYVYVTDVVRGIELAFDKGRKGRTYILGGENHSYRDFFRILASVSGIDRKMIRIPLFLSYFIAWLQLMFAKLTGRDPLITPKWVVKAKYDWEVSSERAVRELGYEITSLKDGLQKMIDYPQSEG